MAFNNSWFDETHASILDDVAQEKITDKAKWPVFVYDWINKTPNTESGLKSSNELRTPHYQWTEIIKGNQSVYLSPSGATKLTKHQGTGKKIPGTDKVDGSYYEVEYSKEDSVVFYGIKTNQGGGNTFSSTSFGGFGDFTTISDQETIQMKTTQKISKDMLTKFFYIPDVAQIVENNNAGQYDQKFNDNDIFYIQDYTNYFNENTGDFVYSEVTFGNLQQNMSQSGQIIEQHVYLASPGAGYLVPKLLFDNKGTPIGGQKGWEWNTEFTTDRGVKTIQIEVSGNYAFAALEIWGYPVDSKHNTYGDKRWYAPRKLLVENFKLPLNENFYKVSPNNNEFIIADGKLTATADLGSYKHMVHDFAGDAQMTYQGILNTTKSPTQDTNRTGFTINDKQWGVPDSFLDGTLKEDGETKNTDFENFYTTDSQWFYDGKKPDGTDGIGQKTINLKDIHRTTNTNHSAVQLMNIMSFALQPINRLPFAIESKLTWSTADFPGFGGWLNRALLGMSPTWRTINISTDTLMPKLQTIPLFMNKDFYDLASNSVYESNSINPNNQYFAWDLSKVSPSNNQKSLGKVPLDFFQKNESDVLGAVMSNKSNSTSMTFTLTDKMWAMSYDENDKKGSLENVSTVMINQNIDGKRYKVDSTSYSTPSIQKDEEVLTDVNGESYIITNIGFKGIGDGDVRITCFNDDIDNIPADVDYHEYINFQTYLKTTAAYKNNQIREWFTNLDTSYLDVLDKYINQKFEWPAALPIPQPETVLPNINITRNNISDFAVWKNINKMNNINATYSVHEGNKMPNSEYYNSSFNVDLLDITEYGYSNVKDFINDYESISLYTDQLHFALLNYAYIGGFDYQTQGNWEVPDGSQEKIVQDIYNDTQIKADLNISNIPVVNSDEDLSDDYLYSNPVGASFNGTKHAYVQGEGQEAAFKTINIKDTTKASGWYSCLYFKGTQLYLKIFLEANVEPTVWADNMASPRVAYDSLFFWLGFTNGNVIDDRNPISVPQVNKNNGWPAPNERLLGNKNNYWNITAHIQAKKPTK